MLTGDHVSIRPLREADSALFFRWWNDPEVMRHVGFPDGLQLSREAVRQRIADAVRSGRELAESRRFVIEDLDSGTPIGEISYSRWDQRGSRVAIGIKICEKNARRKGRATEALRLFSSHLFQHLGVHDISLDTLAGNLAARRLYGKVGFREMETRQNGYFCEASSSHEDVVKYELSRDALPGIA